MGSQTKEARSNHIPLGDSRTVEGSIDENWKRWNHESENYLCDLEGKNDKGHRGRGHKIACVKNTFTAPQDNTEGFAVTEESVS